MPSSTLTSFEEQTRNRDLALSRLRLRLFGLGVVATCVVVGLVVRDPHTPSSWGVCPSTLVGCFCPGCGSLRAIHDLFTFKFGQAVGHNVLTVPALVYILWWWVSSVLTTFKFVPKFPPTSAMFCYGLLVVLVVFTVLRNLPGSPLAP